VDAAQGLFVVSDGMADPVAPQIVIDELPGRLRARLDGLAPDDPRAAGEVRRALAGLSAEVRAEGARRPGRGWLGATVVLAVVRGRQALLAHLGDSRIYLHRGGRLEPLTRDHTLLNEMIDRGEVTPERARGLRATGGPSRFVGMFGEAEADTRLLDLRPGDRLLLCSDGLTAMLSDAQIAGLLGQFPEPAEACRRLVEAANAAGGEDNVTALVVAVPE